MYHPMLIFDRHTGCRLAARLRPGNASDALFARFPYRTVVITMRVGDFPSLAKHGGWSGYWEHPLGGLLLFRGALGLPEGLPE
jgi:hypothetical protein